jgi:hypothetical protein
MIGKVRAITVDVSKRFIDRLIHRRNRLESAAPVHELVIGRVRAMLRDDVSFRPADNLDMAILLAWGLEQEVHTDLVTGFEDLYARMVADHAVSLALLIAGRMVDRV